jgi:hypothetical protein
LPQIDMNPRRRISPLDKFAIWFIHEFQSGSRVRSPHQTTLARFLP